MQYTYKNVWLEIRLKYSTFWFQSSIWKDYFSKIGKTLFKDKYWTKLNWFDSSSSTFWSAKKWQLFATSHERWDSSGKKKTSVFLNVWKYFSPLTIFYYFNWVKHHFNINVYFSKSFCIFEALVHKWASCYSQHVKHSTALVF